MPTWDERPAILAGLIGAGIGGSLSPALHEREGAEQGLRLIYRRLDLTAPGRVPSTLPALLDAAERTGFAGVNVTHPAKQDVLALLDDVSDDARALGAVNTVVLRDGRRVGHNTDGTGFAAAFARGLPDVTRDRVVQLGAGGAGAAVAHALLGMLRVGRLAIADTDPARAAALVAALRSRFGAGRALPVDDLPAAAAEADGVVNCTPVGMARYPGLPLPEALLRPALWVAEIIYVPLETPLLRAARARGCRTLGGGGMAVFQAAGAFRLFTGVAPDAERMLRHFETLAAGAGQGTR